MTRLYATQCLIAALWATVAACTALVGITQAVALSHWPLVALLALTALGALSGAVIALRTRALARQL